MDAKLPPDPARQKFLIRTSHRHRLKAHSVGRATAARPSSRLLYSKPPLQSFTKVSSPQKAKPSEGTPQGPVDRGLAAVYFGANSVASALNLPQERDLPKNHSHFKPNFSIPASKPDISTLRGIGHFYFALTGNASKRAASRLEPHAQIGSRASTETWGGGPQLVQCDDTGSGGWRLRDLRQSAGQAVPHGGQIRFARVIKDAWNNFYFRRQR